MIASSVKINPDLLNQKLSQKRKRKLRESAVKEYILSRPYLAPITLEDFQRVLGMNSSAQVYQFIKGMVKRGQLTKEQLPGKRTSGWIVQGDVKVVKPASAHGGGGQLPKSWRLWPAISPGSTTATACASS